MHARVLLADRDEQWLFEAARALEDAGHSVRCLTDTSNLIAEVLQYLPHLILLNWGMPGILAETVATLLRRQPMIFPIRLIASVERGETLEEAEASVRREFGNVGLVKEVTREMWDGCGWNR